MKKLFIKEILSIFILLICNCNIKAGEKFTREEKLLFDAPPNTYIGIYIEDPIFNDYRSQQFMSDWWFMTCPENTMGNTISGIYHLYIKQNDKIISDVIIPSSFIDESKPANTQELCYKNTPENNCRYFNFNKNNTECGENLSKNSLEVTEIIQLYDYTGDGKRNEFILTGIQDACGWINRMVAGFDDETNSAILYKVIQPDHVSEWNYRFIPDSNGECKVEWACGDHGAEEDEIWEFKFDKTKKVYVLTNHIVNPCN